MKKNILFLFVVLMFTSCQSKSLTFNNLPKLEVRQDEIVSYQNTYKMLNKSEIYTSIFKNSLNGIVEEVREFSKSINNDFAEKPYEGKMFPSSLIFLLEEALYHSSGYTPTNITEAKHYFNLLKSLGSETSKLTLEEMRSLFPQIATHMDDFQDEYDAYRYLSDSEYCVDIFHFSLDGTKENYLFCYDSGGSYGQYHLSLTEFKDGKFTVISYFDTQNNGYSKVIKYENNFYYIFLQYNYNLKNYDSIRMHKLGTNADTENILISYIPEEFVWKKIYLAYTNNETKLTEYIDSIKEDITKADYIEEGSVNSFLEYFTGDESEELEFPLTEKYKSYYKIDFANRGVPVFFSRCIFMPSNYNTSIYLKSNFYIFDEEERIMELNELELDNSGGFDNQLIQLWFKEIDGKVFTFQIYHLFDYNYMLNVILIEDDQVTQIRKDLFAPKRKFKLVEGIPFKYF